MNAINYNVSIRSSLFAKYYFELRELGAKKSKQFKLKPLSSDEAKLLEVNIYLKSFFFFFFFLNFLKFFFFFFFFNVLQYYFIVIKIILLYNYI